MDKLLHVCYICEEKFTLPIELYFHKLKYHLLPDDTTQYEELHSLAIADAESIPSREDGEVGDLFSEETPIVCSVCENKCAFISLKEQRNGNCCKTRFQPSFSFGLKRGTLPRIAQGSSKRNCLYYLYRSSSGKAPKVDHIPNLERFARRGERLHGFSGPFVPCGVFASHASEMASISVCRSPARRNILGELFTPAAELKNAIIDNDIGEAMHLIFMTHPGQGMCMFKEWKYWLVNLGKFVNLSKVWFIAYGSQIILKKVQPKCLKIQASEMLNFLEKGEHPASDSSLAIHVWMQTLITEQLCRKHPAIPGRGTVALCDELDSEIDELDSEIDELDSEIDDLDENLEDN